MKQYRLRAAAFAAALMLLCVCASQNSSAPYSSPVTETAAGTEQASSAEPEPEKEKKPVTEGSVEFSAESGVYSESFELTLTSSEQGEIYYTTDGSDPALSSTAKKYESPITVTDRRGEANGVSAVDPLLIAGTFNEPDSSRKGFISKVSAPSDKAVDKCTAVRAAVKREDGSFGGNSSACYFIGTAEEHIRGLAESCKAAGQPLAVISLAMDYDDLFDSEKGIYVKGDIFDRALAAEGRVKDGETARSLDANYKQHGKEWERQAGMTFMEFSAEGSVTRFTQDCGVRIQGNYSRSDLQKGLRLYARAEYGGRNFSCPVFGEDYHNDAGETMDKFDTLVLRAGGNCAFTAKFNDTYWQSLMREGACETKRSRPCVVYLNGEYWGLYVLEEDYSDDYFEDKHGVDKDDVVVYKGDAEKYESGYKLDEGRLPEGESEDYFFKELKAFFNKHKDASSDEDFAALCALVDPDSVRDYFAYECWINNKWDWPGKNWSMWKTASVSDASPYADGRWRFMLYDVEFGGVSGSSDAGVNTVKEDNYKPKGLLDMDTNNPAVLCFAYMMTNEGFRQGFYERLEGLSTGELERSAAKERLKEFENIYSPLYEQFFERYPGTGSADEAVNGGYASIRCISDFLDKRAASINKLIKYCRKTLGS